MSCRKADKTCAAAWITKQDQPQAVTYFNREEKKLFQSNGIV